MHGIESKIKQKTITFLVQSNIGGKQRLNFSTSFSHLSAQLSFHSKIDMRLYSWAAMVPLLAHIAVGDPVQTPLNRPEQFSRTYTTWAILGPFPTGMREQDFGADPLEPYGMSFFARTPCRMLLAVHKAE
jgi:hypothetical protein